MEYLGSFLSVTLVGAIEDFPATFVNLGDIRIFYLPTNTLNLAPCDKPSNFAISFEISICT